MRWLIDFVFSKDTKASINQICMNIIITFNFINFKLNFIKQKEQPIVDSIKIIASSGNVNLSHCYKPYPVGV